MQSQKADTRLIQIHMKKFQNNPTPTEVTFLFPAALLTHVVDCVHIWPASIISRTSLSLDLIAIVAWFKNGVQPQSFMCTGKCIPPAHIKSL